MEVIIDDSSDRLSKKWSDQFVADMKYNRRRVGMLTRPSTEQAIKTITQAVTSAGPGGTVIFSVGHGATDQSLADPSVGMVELAPHGALRLTRELVFYDFDMDGSSPGKSQKDDDDQLEQDLKNISSAAGLAEAKKYQSASQIADYKQDLQMRVNAAKKRRKEWETYRRVCDVVQRGAVGKVVLSDFVWR